MSFKKRLASIIGMAAFTLPFLVMFPAFVVFSQNPKWHKYAYRLNHWWARSFFYFGRMRIDISYLKELDPNQQYIFCPNHSSFLDIPTMGLHNQGFSFVGKSSISKVPFFGYMYRKLHITVDRNSLKSRYETVIKSQEAIEAGKSLVIFPEGGILAPNPPRMSKFKDGPFRVAIEKQVPIVPVTIPHNWIILPDDGKFLLDRWSKKVKVIFHEPIITTGMTMDDMEELKSQTYKIINTEITRHSGDH